MTVRVSLFTAIVFASCTSEDLPLSDETAIYVEVLQQEQFYPYGRSLTDEGAHILLLDRTRNELSSVQIDGPRPDVFDEGMAFRLRALSSEEGTFSTAGVPYAVFESLVEAHRAGWEPVPEFELEHVDVMRVDEREYRALVDDVGHSEALKALGVGGDGYLGVKSVSPIGFSEDRLSAAVAVNYGLAGYVLFLARLPQGWRVTGHVKLWVS